MKRTRRNRRTLVQNNRKSEIPQPGKSLIVIDNKPIRKKAIGQCRKVLSKLEKIRKEWQRFETFERPAFTRWYHGKFGSTLTEIQELHRKSDELEETLDHIDFLKHSRRLSYYQAYLLYNKIRETGMDPEEDLDESPFAESFNEHDYDPEDNPADDPYEDGIPEFMTEEELLEQYIQMIQEFIGREVDPDSEFFRQAYEEFKQTIGWKSAGHVRGKPNPENSETQTDNRLKERYRALALRLHPDTRKNADSDDEIWHEVQRAYREKDIEAMDMLSALCDIRMGRSDFQESVSSLQHVKKKYESAVRSMEKQIRKTKKNDPAWNFSSQSNVKKLEKEMNAHLQYKKREETDRLRYFESVLKRWSRLPKPRTFSSKKNTQKTSPATGSSRQFDFAF